MRELKDYLDDIESRLDGQQEQRILDQWEQYVNGRWQESYFMPRRAKSESGIEWPEININDCLESDELMIIDQFAKVSQNLSRGFGGLLSVRPNFGVGTLPSLFGAPPFIMPRDMNTLPNVKELPGGIDAIKDVVNGNIPDLNEGHGAGVFRIASLYNDIFKQYPLISKYIRADHPDCQGPMDVSELLWGSDIFLALYDESELVHSLLNKVSETYKAFLGKWFDLMPKKDSMNAFFGNAYLGAICIRDDSAMNISPEMYKEFILPYDSALLTHFNGGAIHSCGRVDHFISFLTDIPDLHGFNLSQPDYNDMDVVFQNTADRGLPLLGLQKEAVLAAHSRGRDLKGLVSIEQNSSV